MKHFLCISILLMLTACASSVPSRQPAQVDVSCVNKFKPIFSSDLYSASVDVMRHHISGLVLFKVMPDSSKRIVFTNEAGVKFFDFGFERNGKIMTHQVMKKLNKRIVVRTLQKDFGLVLMEKIEKEIPSTYREGDNLKFVFGKKKEEERVVTNADCTKLVRLEKGPYAKPQTIARIFSVGVRPPDSIFIEHLNFNMKIKLTHLVR